MLAHVSIKDGSIRQYTEKAPVDGDRVDSGMARERERANGLLQLVRLIPKCTDC